ncbi:MAG: polysaccharide deacetylase family protein [Myxococcales bacterium]
MPDPIRTSPGTTPATTPAAKPDKATTTTAQTQLTKLGYNPGVIDGLWGPKTSGAVKAFQAANKLPQTGQLDTGTLSALAKAAAQIPDKPTVTPTKPNQVDTFKRNVNLTFDDGPHPVNTPRVLDILKRHDVKATFFVTGQGVEAHPELIRQIVAEGHTLGNHTFTHANLSKLTPAQAKAEFDRTQAAIDKALGNHYELKMVRPPYGAGSSVARSAAPKQDIVLWNVDSNDWRYKNDDAKIMANVFAGSESVYARGGTILFHDIHPQTVRILDDVISRLEKEGFKIERTEVMLERKHAPIS